MRPATILFTCTAALMLGACQREPAAPATTSAAPAITTLEKTDLVRGTGEGISQGQRAVVHYTGWLYDPNAAEQKGKEFDSSLRRGQPFEFTVGAGAVIRGWDEGVQGMQPGGHRRLVIPADLAYGENGAGGVIPPNAPLVFEVELLAIK
jgi:FKBP-type peptidyl-prolyl cis-trans isomerase FkpA